MQKHPRKDDAVAYALANPTVTYAEVSKLYGVKEKSLGVWLLRERQRIGTLAAPPRGVGFNSRPRDVVVATPPPAPTAPPPDLAEDFREAARAAAARVRALASDPKLSLKDALSILELTIRQYAHVPAMQGEGQEPPEGQEEQAEQIDNILAMVRR